MSETNIYFFTLQRFGPSPSLNFKWVPLTVFNENLTLFRMLYGEENGFPELATEAPSSTTSVRTGKQWNFCRLLFLLIVKCC